MSGASDQRGYPPQDQGCPPAQQQGYPPNDPSAPPAYSAVVVQPATTIQDAPPKYTPLPGYPPPQPEYPPPQQGYPPPQQDPLQQKYPPQDITPPIASSMFVQQHPVMIFEDKPVTLPDGNVTILSYRNGALTWILVCAICLLTWECCICCVALIPLCANATKDVEHVHPVTGQVVGIYKRL